MRKTGEQCRLEPRTTGIVPGRHYSANLHGQRSEDAKAADSVLDRAGQKGTGKWTVQIALELGVPIPTIAAALDARILSSMKEERVAAGCQYNHPSSRYMGDNGWPTFSGSRAYQNVGCPTVRGV